MIDAAAIGEVIAQYEKHGWKLRRALLSDAAGADSIRFDEDVAVIRGDMDALWFSRRSQPNSEAWELRRLTGSPFALIAVVGANSPSEELEDALAQVERDMLERTNA